MPVYEYTCDKCREVFERTLPIVDRDDKLLTMCDCGYTSKRGTGCANFILKGSCWERDNYFKRRKP